MEWLADLVTRAASVRDTSSVNTHAYEVCLAVILVLIDQFSHICVGHNHGQDSKLKLSVGIYAKLTVSACSFLVFTGVLKGVRCQIGGRLRSK